MKRLFALLLAMSLLLCACAAKPEETEPETTATPETTGTEPPATTSTEPEATEPVTEPEETLLYCNPVTGEPLAEPMLVRPYAVAMDNDCKDSTPHWGCSRADMIWELPHEGGTTRMVGVFTSLEGIDKLGPTRSVRPYVLSVAQCFNAILVHAGGSPQGYSLLKETGWNNLDGVQGSGAGSYYKRDKDRLNKVDSWHTMYITAENVQKYTEKLGYSTTFEEPADYGMTFAADATPTGGETATTITVRLKSGCKKTIFHYDETAGAYTAEQFGAAYSDGNDGTVPYFENILVLKTSVSTLDDYGRLNVAMVGSGEGYFACNGQMVPIKWSRSSANSPYTYTLEDDTPLTLGIGKTYVFVTYNSGSVKVG